MKPYTVGRPAYNERIVFYNGNVYIVTRWSSGYSHTVVFQGTYSGPGHTEPLSVRFCNLVSGAPSDWRSRAIGCR